jgi:hypothetical protein
VNAEDVETLDQQMQGRFPRCGAMPENILFLYVPHLQRQIQRPLQLAYADTGTDGKNWLPKLPEGQGSPSRLKMNRFLPDTGIRSSRTLAPGQRATNAAAAARGHPAPRTARLLPALQSHRGNPDWRRGPPLRRQRLWKDVGQRLLDDICQQRTGSHEDDGCWPNFET